MRWLFLWPLLGLALPLVVDGKDRKDAKDPANALQGQWTVVSMVFAGYELKGTAERPLKIIFAKDRIVFRPTIHIRNTASVSISLCGLKPDRSIEFAIFERDEEVSFRLDPSKSPARIDLMDGDKEGAKGIYRLHQDELELCMARLSTSKRPKEIKASDSATLWRLKRKANKD